MADIKPLLDDNTPFENVERGFIDCLEPCIIKDDHGRVIWDNDSYSFLSETTCPETAHPKLWRQAQLVSKQGLFKVLDGIYQIRGLDLSNMTVIEGDTGIVVIDPLTSAECAEAALKLYRKNRGNRTVVGMVYTHCHADHFGGSEGVLSDSHGIDFPILAPMGFLEHAISENVYAGNAMARRAAYMYGDQLPRNPSGQISCGLGATVSSGRATLLPPTVDIDHTGQSEVIDGIKFVFQLTPGTEAPAEMNFYIPQWRALCTAENATQCLHNISTLRGAAIRDAMAWSSYLDETIRLFTEKTDVSFASHHWPTWGQDAVVDYLTKQRDLYAFLHDQTVRLMNDGFTGPEIADQLQVPPQLQQAWHTQGFYGSVSHNVKGIYQRYMTWFDGNPAHLWEHTPTAAATRYVSCMGGVGEVLKKADKFKQEGDLRFAATLLNHAVYADSTNEDARTALAGVYEQLGYGCENGTWRNFYLSGASELRGKKFKGELLSANTGMVGALSLDQLMSSLAVRLDGPRAQTENFTVVFNVSDLEKFCSLTLSNGALIHRTGNISDKQSPIKTDFSCTLTKSELLGLISSGKLTGEVKNESGDKSILSRLFSLMTTPQATFNIVTPRR